MRRSRTENVADKVLIRDHRVLNELLMDDLRVALSLGC